MGKVLLIGEPIALLIAQSVGPLKTVETFTRKLAGAEVNVCFGLARLGHKVSFILRNNYFFDIRAKDHFKI